MRSNNSNHIPDRHLGIRSERKRLVQSSHSREEHTPARLPVNCCPEVADSPASSSVARHHHLTRLRDKIDSGTVSALNPQHAIHALDHLATMSGNCHPVTNLKRPASVQPRQHWFPGLPARL